MLSAARRNLIFCYRNKVAVLIECNILRYTDSRASVVSLSDFFFTYFFESVDDVMIRSMYSCEKVYVDYWCLLN